MSLSTHILDLAKQIEEAKGQFDSREELDDYLAYLAEMEGIGGESFARISKELLSYQATYWKKAERWGSHLGFAVALGACLILARFTPLFPPGPVESFWSLVVWLPIGVALSLMLFFTIHESTRLAYLKFEFPRLRNLDPFLKIVAKEEALPSLRAKEYAQFGLWVFGGLSVWFSISWLGSSLGVGHLLWPAFLAWPIFALWLRRRLSA